jgi:hypothetical protein
MPTTIEGREFSGFPGRDAQALRELTFAGRVAWLRIKMEFFNSHRHLRPLTQFWRAECLNWGTFCS